MPDLTGQSIGRYHIIAPLGEGGMATVYKAFDTRLESNVAIKFIRKENILPNQWQHMTARFEREAKRMARFTHLNIVKVMDFGEYEGSPYLVMPYLSGGTLKDMLKARSGKGIPYQDAVRILAPVARALQYAHEQDTIHRDVKPANILLTDKGQPMLSDFGVAKILDLDEGNTLTGTGVGVGTPKYMAPEQWMNNVSPQTDVYALGVVLYEMVIGRVPYDADTPAGVMLKQNTEPLPRPKQFVPGLPEDVERVLYKSLAKNPMERYSSMDAFAATLERLGSLTPAPLPHAREGNAATIDYGTAAQPSSSAKSAQSEKSAVQTSSVWDIPAADVKPPIPARPSREHTPTPPPYIPQPPPSVQSQKSALQTFLVVGGIGMGLMILIVIIGGASWLMNRPSKPINVMNNETVQANAQETLTVLGGQTPTVSTDSQNRISAKDGMEMVYIPEGEFLMGSRDSDKDANSNEKPQHKVYLDGYWMDKTEVTNGQYSKCVADGACTQQESKASSTRSNYYGNIVFTNYPVIYVDWSQAQAYCHLGGGNLPSEAQWEKAARGTDGRIYPWGNRPPSCEFANFSDCGEDTKAVGSTPAGVSPYGLMDMAGNVWEWVNMVDPFVRTIKKVVLREFLLS